MFEEGLDISDEWMILLDDYETKIKRIPKLYAVGANPCGCPTSWDVFYNCPQDAGQPQGFAPTIQLLRTKPLQDASLSFPFHQRSDADNSSQVPLFQFQF